MNGALSTQKGWRLAGAAGLVIVLLGLSGCRHHHREAAELPPQELPPVYVPPQPVYRPRAQPTQPTPIPITPVPPGGVSAADLDYVATHRPILTEIGLATWYRAPYKGRKAANGQIFSDEAMTAANRILPMGSLITVTNLQTGQSGTMRITDRGPFVEGRIIDLTIASAKATGIYRTGIARVRVDVYETPKPIETGGRWCVQIGAFKSADAALQFKEMLLEAYPDSNVIEFAGEDSYWVRIRPQGDDREMAEYIASHIHPNEGEAFLTRLD
jgi:rare lipoprotein A